MDDECDNDRRARAGALRIPAGSRRVRSQLYLHAVVSHLDAAAIELTSLRTRLVEDRIGVVDVDQYAARRRRQLVEPVQHAAIAGLRQMADIARGLFRQPKA